MTKTRTFLDYFIEYDKGRDLSLPWCWLSYFDILGGVLERKHYMKELINYGSDWNTELWGFAAMQVIGITGIKVNPVQTLSAITLVYDPFPDENFRMLYETKSLNDPLQKKGSSNCRWKYIYVLYLLSIYCFLFLFDMFFLSNNIPQIAHCPSYLQYFPQALL